MANSKIYQLHKSINDQFPERLCAEFFKRFRRKLTTEWNIISMQLVSRPANGKPFTPQQRAWVESFEAGYLSAMDVAWDAFCAEDTKRQQRAKAAHQPAKEPSK